jgi:hypothetical protein
MPIWTDELPDNPAYPYTPIADPQTCRHPGTWRTIYCDNVTDIIRCDQCGLRAKVACNFDDEYA